MSNYNKYVKGGSLNPFWVMENCINHGNCYCGNIIMCATISNITNDINFNDFDDFMDDVLKDIPIDK